MAPRWSEEMTVRFVRLYREHECLWDQFHEQYKSKSARAAALADMAAQMRLEGFDWKEANRKVKALRATYHSEINKQVASDKAYTPSLKWFAEMKHIVDLGTLKAKTKGPGPTAPGFTPPAQLLRNTDGDGAEISESNQAQGTKRTDRDSVTIVHVPSQSPATTNEDGTPKRFKPTQPQPPLQNRVSQSVENEFEIFGRHVASQLKRLKVEDAVMAMGEINEVLTQKRLISLLGNSGQHFAALTPTTALSSDDDEMDQEEPT